MASYINDLLEFQANFDGAELEAYVQERVEIPVFMVILYLTLVFYIPEVMERRRAMDLKFFVKVWNGILAVFSIFGAYYTIPHLVKKLLEHGWRYTICQDPADGYYHDGAPGLWVALFILSKIPELMDTVFLVLQKKNVLFLHWFHHCTVMLYCWHSYSHRIGAGLWFACMNYGVHGIMYSYYFFMCFSWGRKLVRPFAIYITSLQILQMVVGMTVTVAAFMYSDFKHPKQCATNQANLRMGLLMYASYFILFGSLFNKLYLSKKGGARGASAASPTRGGDNSDICHASVQELVGARSTKGN